MTEGWRFTEAQERELMKYKEGQNVMKGPRVRLRLPTRDEVLRLQAEGGLPLCDRDHLFEVLKKHLENLFARNLMAYDLQTDKKIGTVALFDEDKNGTLYMGMEVVPEERNKGYGQEIVSLTIQHVQRCNKGRIDRLFLMVKADNERALHIYNKFGFQITATAMYRPRSGGESALAHKMELLL